MAPPIKEYNVIMLQTGVTKKANRLFFFLIGMGGLVVMSALALSAVVYPRAVTAGRVLLGRGASVCNCVGGSTITEHPWQFLLLVVITLGVTVFWIVLLYTALHLFFVTWNSLRPFLRNTDKGRGGREMTVVNSATVTAFCAGFLRPRIYISRGLMKLLSQTELAAVVRHEEAHARVYEPLRRYFLRIVSRVLGMIPGVGFLTEEYGILSELGADERATSGFRYRSSLAGALYKMLALEEFPLAYRPVAPSSLAAVSFFTSTMEARVRALERGSVKGVHKSRGMMQRLFMGVFVGGIVGMSLFVVTGAHVSARTQEAQEVLEAESCPNKDGVNSEYCVLQLFTPNQLFSSWFGG